MLDSLGYAVAGLLWLTSIWRFSSALWGDAQRRALWGCYTAFAAAWTLKTPYVVQLVSKSGINDLSTLIKHSIATAGICPLLLYLVAMYGTDSDSGPAARHVRIAQGVARLATKTALAAVLLMAALFFFAIDRSEPTEHFITGHAGDPGMAVYMCVLYLYLGSAAGVCCYQWGSAARRAPRSLLRSGLAMMSLSMGMAVLYILLRVAYIAITSVTPPSEQFASLEETVTESLQLALFPLFALGAGIPATQAAWRRWKAYTALARLNPLWRDLSLAVPGHTLDKPVQLLQGHRFGTAINKVFDLVKVGTPVQVRLARYVTEIHDAILDLRHYAPENLFTRALEHARLSGNEGTAAQAAAEAYWLKGALLAKTRGDAPAPTAAEFKSGAGGDLDTEVPWLLAVQAVYKRTNHEAIENLIPTKATT